MHCHGGYLSQIADSMETVFGCAGNSHERDDKETLLVIASPSWITGQSYMISGALLMGKCSVLLEGSPVAPRPLRWAEVAAANGVTIFGVRCHKRPSKGN